jgi:parallel beta-helix repeat protein
MTSREQARDGRNEQRDGETGRTQSSTSRRGALRAVGVAGLALAGVAPVRGSSTDDCLVLDQPGRYTLDHDVECVEITAPNVQFDAQGNSVIRRVTVTADQATVRNVEGSIDCEIALRSADRCRLVGNTAGQFGYTVEDSHGNVFENNDTTRAAHGITLTNSGQNRLVRNTFRDAEAVTFENSDGNVLMENDIGTETRNVLLVDSHENRIVGNRIHGSPGNGVTLRDSHRNQIQGNEIEIPGPYRRNGVSLEASDRNDVSGNVITARYRAISLSDADRNTVRDNRLEGDRTGVELTEADRNALSRNRLRGHEVGFDLVDADRNVLYRNRLCDVATGVRTDGASTGNLQMRNETDCSWV